MVGKLDDYTANLLKKIVEDYWKEDSAVRERQIRQYRHLKLLWDGFSRTWWSETAHDWRVYDQQASEGGSDQSFYDKPINVFRAYLETIIAALSILVPPIKCYPDDADNPLDLLTAKAGDKIAQLIYRHNNANLLWLNSLFIYCTEGMVACYTYAKEDKAYGTYDTNEYDEVEEIHETQSCPVCGEKFSDEIVSDEFQPETPDVQMCPACEEMIEPEVNRESFTVTRLIGTTRNPKSRIHQEVYGGLYVKVPNYAKRQSDCPYLFYSYETHFALARERFPEIRSKIQPNEGSSHDPYERWGRQNPAYQGEFPQNNVTIRNCWLRPSAFEALDENEAKHLKKKFPSGVRVAMVNDNLAEYENESLDDSWTLTHNPLSDFLTFDPLGLLLVSVQEITNDIVSLTQQTIEHGIPQTFADENVLDFKAYSQMETTPGAIYPAKARTGKSIGEGFYEVKTATLSQEVLPFLQQVQGMGQLVVGALPSLFGGDIQGSKTASQYSMSRAQALQRLQNTWKMFTSWWKEIYGKAIPAYIKEVKDDERFVNVDDSGNFINVFIRKAELEGKIGNVELEANENLPVTWSQRKDVIMQLMEANNPQILQMLASPENLQLIYEAIGLTDFSIPGLESRTKQYEEIKALLNSEPIEIPPTEEEIQIGASVGQEVAPIEKPSVAVEEFDNHAVELEICIKWINSEAGQQAKADNPAGYMNTVLHAREHKTAMMEELMQNAAMASQGQAPLPNAEPNLDAPISGDGDVKTN